MRIDDAHPVAVRGCKFRATILTYSGAVLTTPTSPDTQLNKDRGTPAAASDEVSEIDAGMPGILTLDLDAAEIDSTETIVEVNGTGIDTRALVLRPERWVVIHSATAQAGAAGAITLDANASPHDGAFAEAWVRVSGDTPTDALGQLRYINSYVGTTKVATIRGDWGTSVRPISTTPFEIVVPASQFVAAISKLQDAYFATAGAIKSGSNDLWSATQWYDGTILNEADQDAAPTLTVRRESTGAILFGPTAMTKVPGMEGWRLDSATQMVLGARYMPIVTISNNGGTHVVVTGWVEGRDQ